MLGYVIIIVLLLIYIIIIRKQLGAIQQKLHHLSVTDELTEVYNRRYLISELEKYINKSRRHDTDFTLIFLDINDFKSINDTFGHSVGDNILKILGQTIKNNLRNYDIGARYEGDEFLVLLPNTSVADALRIAKRITSEFSTLTYEKTSSEITLAFGVISGENQALEDILIAADEKMYMNKVKKQNMK